MLALRVSRCAVRPCCPAVARPARSQAVRRLAAAAADEALDNSFVYGEESTSASEAEAGDGAKPDIPLPTYHLNVLFLDKCIGLAVDQMLASGEKAPVTEYYMWPSKDAWDLLKTQLESMPWISQTECIHLLNSATQVINFWQDEEVKHTMDEAATAFPDITFLGA